jgi:WD40 repeat protein
VLPPSKAGGPNTRPGTADVKVRPDERFFATGGWDHRVRAFRFGGKSPGAPLAVLRCHAESVQALAFGPATAMAPSGGGGGGGGGGSMMTMPLASGGKDARIALWDLYPPGPERDVSAAAAAAAAATEAPVVDG